MFEPVAAVEDYLRGYLERRAMPGNLRDAMIYSIFAGGKRLRPLLAVRCCEAVAAPAEQAWPAAAAIELIHCFSLVHDDLPALDNDDLRRGRPTLHRHSGEAMAILAGDGMMGLAFELLATAVADPTLAAGLLAELSVATNNMICGQVYDTLPDFPQAATPMERLETIHHNKTGALIRCACRMGALAGGAGPDQLQAVTAYADAIGLMFQVVDDLLDVTQTTAHLGKTAGKDIAQNKLTYPSLLGIEQSQAKVTELQQAAHHALSPLGPSAEPLAALCDFLAVRTK